MGSYWAAAGVVIGVEGATLKYLVWDFLFGKQSLEEYWQNVEDAQNAIHERKFLPIIVSVCDSVVVRKGMLSTAETIEILNEFSISARLREDALNIVSDRIALDRSYVWSRMLSFCVAIPCAVFVFLSCLLFFGNFDAQTGVRSIFCSHLVIPTVVIACIGFIGLCLYILARCTLVRLVRRAN
jgi:hypothetical protein